MDNQIRKFDQIDSLRGIAALMVVVAHALNFGDNKLFPILPRSILSQGIRGVHLFYIISAFTLFYTFDLRKNENKAILKFYLRRFFRIAPLFYTAIVINLAYRHLSGNLAAAEYPTYFNIISNFLFIHGFGPFWDKEVVPGGWTIGVEFPFYILLPWLFLRIKTLSDALKWQARFLWIGIVAPFVFLKIKVLTSLDPTLNFIFPFFLNQLMFFGFGIILYFLVVKKERFLETDYKTIYIIILQFLLSSILLKYFILNFWAVHSLFEALLFSFSISILIYFLLTQESKIIGSQILNFYGKISYSLYLTHYLCYYLIAQYNFHNLYPGGSVFPVVINYIIRLFLCLALSTCIAYFLNQTIEIPFQNLGRKIIKSFSNPEKT